MVLNLSTLSLLTILSLSYSRIRPTTSIFSSLCTEEASRVINLPDYLNTDRVRESQPQFVNVSGSITVYGKDGLIIWPVSQYLIYDEQHSMFQLAVLHHHYQTLLHLMNLLETEIYLDVNVSIFDEIVVCGRAIAGDIVMYGRDAMVGEDEICHPLNLSVIPEMTDFVGLRISQRGRGTIKTYEMYPDYAVHNMLLPRNIGTLTRVRFRVKGTVDLEALVVPRLGVVICECYKLYILKQKHPLVTGTWVAHTLYHTLKLYQNLATICDLIKNPGVYNVIHRDNTRYINGFENIRLQKVRQMGFSLLQAEYEADFRLRRNETIEVYSPITRDYHTLDRLLNTTFKISESLFQLGMTNYAHNVQCHITIINITTQHEEKIHILSFEKFNMTQDMAGIVIDIYSRTVPHSNLVYRHSYLKRASCGLEGHQDEGYLHISPNPKFKVEQTLRIC